MCIFAFPVEQVSNTRIAVIALPNGEQLTVYENSASTTSSNAMILPIPKGEKSPVLLDMSKHKNFWQKCESFFPQREVMAAGFGMNFGGGGGWSAKTLPVERVGSYNCTIVPSIEDISRVHQLFKLPPNIGELLAKHYANFSFLVCLFDRRASGHPIAYVSASMADGSLFVPTMHEHGHSGLQSGRKKQRGFVMAQDLEIRHARGEIIHPNVFCDNCSAMPIVGSRHKCLQCENFDLCDHCYETHKEFLGKVHNQEHVFIEYVRPKQVQQVVAIDAAEAHKQEKASNGEVLFAEFDHTLFFFNAVATSLDYSRKEEGNKMFLRSTLLLAPSLLPAEPEIRFAQKLVVNGEFPNKDYYAARIR